MSDSAPLNDEFGFLDILLVLAENWLLLVIAPLIACGVAYMSLAWAFPVQYQSEAVIRIDAEKAAILSSARVLNEAIVNTGLTAEHEGSMSQARQALGRQYSVDGLAETGLYRLTILAETGERAQIILSAIIASAIKNSGPTLTERERLEMLKEQTEKSIVELQESLNRVNMIADRAIESDSPLSDVNLGELGQSAVSILSSIESRQENLFDVEHLLVGSISSDDVFQPPTLSDSAQPNGTTLRALLVGVGVGVALVFVGFFRELARREAANPGTVSKVNRIRKAFWLSPVPR